MQKKRDVKRRKRRKSDKELQQKRLSESAKKLRPKESVWRRKLNSND